MRSPLIPTVSESAPRVESREKASGEGEVEEKVLEEEEGVRKVSRARERG